ncbi:MAG: pyruvate, phosphate dikinase [Verrucomicrobia bacterium GWF2_51_19]|nr:MAG: pyruvate, phosphate dikinase [Verrucomicrobia bacterium GWF2_51_19]
MAKKTTATIAKKTSAAKKTVVLKKAPAKKSAPTNKGVKYIYEFGKKTDGNATMKSLLGGKGANLAEMARIGLPVPPGFTITTEVCTYYTEHKKAMPAGIDKTIRACIANIEAQEGKKFGDAKNPLLFSVRSGARESMPGMMDTILNLGLNDETVEGQSKKTGNPRFAYDCYRRFIQMYGDVVMGVQAQSDDEHEPFDEILAALKKEKGVQHDTQLNAEDLKKLIGRYKALIKRRTGSDFPQDVVVQLNGAIGAVFESWNNERAIIYRQKYNIPSEWGTAVNVQSMVFGNMGETSATGVAFTRDPANGQKVFYGEYLVNAQGEDVVAGIRTPHPIADMKKEMPASHKELETVRAKLETHFRDMQDFEFTIEEGKLYMLQTRNGKRTGLAAIRIAVEMVHEKLIDKEMAVKRIPADSIATLLVPIFDANGRKKVGTIAKGLPAGPGAASGKVVFSAKRAEEMASTGDKVVLCRIETSPEDIRGMLAAEGILTCRGGVSSHAALVARQMGKVCVCGVSAIEVDYSKRTMSVAGKQFKEGDFISIDGTLGEVYAGSVETAPSEVNQVLAGKMKAKDSETYQLFETVMKWADSYRTLGIRTNADTPEQSAKAVALGAEGIGLCRTEHMFFEGDRIDSMREMILASSEEARRAALKKLLPFQRDDFEGIFKAMKGFPVTIRLLDPPLHEFLPQDDDSQKALAKKLGIDAKVVKARVAALHEMNPMLGHRGCRLGISYPEITEMQARAIFEAAANVMKEKVEAKVEVMVPLVGFKKEFDLQAALIRETADKVMAEKKVKIDYTIGTMIELPRAALRAAEIAASAEFFSFGTNDLTQTALGMSRDDMGNFFQTYMDSEIFKQNPFATIDTEGVGELIQIATERGKSVRPKIKLGICGEHGGDPASVKFCHKVGLTYVSCSPNRVPIARLAAAQAALGK